MSIELSVQGIMNQNFETITPENTVREAADILKNEKAGAVAVMDGDKIAGMFSERDIVTKVVSQDLDYKTTKISEVMTSPVLTLPMDAMADEALEIMTSKKIRHLPVVDTNGKLRGMLEARALLETIYDYFVDLFLSK